MISDFRVQQRHLGRPVKNRVVGLSHFWFSVGVELGPRICISSKLPDGAADTGGATALEKFFGKMHCTVFKCSLGLNIYQTAFNATVALFTKVFHSKNYRLPFWLTKKFH